MDVKNMRENREISYTSSVNKYVSFIVDKSFFHEYISNNIISNEGICVKEELLIISKEDEVIIIKYLLDVMKRHGIITEEEYHAVLYKYS